MSAHQTYALICDGDGCNERFVTAVAPPRMVSQTRARAAGVGWSHSYQPLPPHVGGQAFSKDWCPSCTKKREAR